LAAMPSSGDHEIGGHAPCYVSAAPGHGHQKSVWTGRELFRGAQLAGAYVDDLLSFEMPGKPSTEFERS